MAGIADQLCVLLEGTLGSLRSRGLPLFPALLKLLGRDLKIQDSLLSIDDNGIAILDQANGATDGSLRDNVTNQETVAATGETAISDQSNVLAETSSHDSTAGLQHLRHTGTTLGTLISDNDNSLLTLLDLAALECLDEAILVVVALGLAYEPQAFLAGDLADGTTGGERPAEDLDMASGLNGVAQGADDGLVGGEVGELGDVLLHGLTGDGDAGAVDDSLLDEELEKGGGTANLVQILHDILARRLEISQERCPVGDGLEVVDSELNSDGVGNGDQVEDGVGATTEDGRDNHGVLESLASKNILGTDILTEEVLDDLTNVLALGPLAGVLGGKTAAAGNSHTEGLDGGGHSVGGVHATAGTATGAGVADDVEPLLLVDLAGDVLSIGLESADNVDGLTLHAAAGLDGTAVNHDTGSVDTAHSNEHTGHVLVAARQRDVGIVPLSVHNSLDTIGNDLSALQAVAHTNGAHTDTVRDTNGVEAHGHESGASNAVMDYLGEVEKVHVARVALIPDGRDTDLGLGHVLLGQPGGVEHRLRRALGLGLCDGRRDLVELLIGISASARGEEAAM